jgi:ABC-type sugar transport system substrate-binding protein
VNNLYTKSVAAALGVFGLIMSQAAANAAAQGKKVAYFDVQPHPYVTVLSDSFKARAKELGMEVTQFTTPFDPTLQSQQIDDAIARKFDLLAIQGASQSAIVPAIGRAKKAGIPVIIVNNGIKDGVEDLYVSELIDDNAKLGEFAAESMMKAFKENGRQDPKVALITGDLAEGVAKVRLNGFNAVMKIHPEVKVVATEDAHWMTDKSEQLAGQLFARFASQGGVDAMVSWGDNQSGAIVRAAEAAHVPLGAEKGKLVVVGMVCDAEGLDLIKAGKQYSTGTADPFANGKKSAEMAADYFNGKTLPKHVMPEPHTVTRDNIATYTKACSYW